MPDLDVKTFPVSTRLPAPEYEYIKTISEQEDRAVSNVIYRIVKQHMQEQGQPG